MIYWYNKEDWCKMDVISSDFYSRAAHFGLTPWLLMIWAQPKEQHLNKSLGECEWRKKNRETETKQCTPAKSVQFNFKTKKQIATIWIHFWWCAMIILTRDVRFRMFERAHIVHIEITVTIPMYIWHARNYVLKCGLLVI